MTRATSLLRRYDWLLYIAAWPTLLILAWWLRRPDAPVATLAPVLAAPPHTLSHNPLTRP